MAIQPAGATGFVNASVPDASALTMMCWYYWPVAPISTFGPNVFALMTDQVFATAYYDYGIGGTTFLPGTGKLVAEYFDGGTTFLDAIGTVVLVPGQWYHVVVVKDGLQHRVYLSDTLGNYDLRKELETTFPALTPTVLAFTLDGFSAQPMPSIANVKVWEAVLTDAEMRRERDQWFLDRTSRIYCLTPLREPTDFTDKAGLGHNWSVSASEPGTGVINFLADPTVLLEPDAELWIRPALGGLVPTELISGEPSTCEVLEQTTPRYAFTLVDDSLPTPVALPASLLFSLTLSLYVIKADGTTSFINSRNVQNVLNASNVTVDQTGQVVWSLQVADTTLVETLSFERHIALWTWSWAGGTKVGRHEVVFVVKNLTTLP